MSCELKQIKWQKNRHLLSKYYKKTNYSTTQFHKKIVWISNTAYTKSLAQMKAEHSHTDNTWYKITLVISSYFYKHSSFSTVTTIKPNESANRSVKHKQSIILSCVFLMSTNQATYFGMRPQN